MHQSPIVACILLTAFGVILGQPPMVAGQQATGQRAGTPEAFLYTDYRGLLLTGRDLPELLTDDAMAALAQSQIRSEQEAWKIVDNRVAAVPPARARKERTSFTYEWQTYADRTPDMASGPLLDAFLRRDGDWSFVTGDPEWPSGFTGPVEVFLFARESIEGRDHRFAARELASVYGRHLKAAIARAPTRFWLPLRLPPGAYDFQAKALRFLPMGASVTSGARAVEQQDLLYSVDLSPSNYRVPAEADRRATYLLLGVTVEARRAEPPSTKPGYAMNGSPADAWRGLVVAGASSNAVPPVELLALDRRVQISSVPIEAGRAEALAKRQPNMPAIDGFTAKVFFDAERVVLGTRTLARQPERVAVLLARVQRVEVLDPDGQLLTSIQASSLPSPPPATVATPPPARPAAPVPSQADRVRERQQQTNQAIGDRTAQIRARNEVAMAVQRQAQTRVNACIQRAARANPNQSSPAYQQAVQECSQKARQMGACVQQADQARLTPGSAEYQRAVDACVEEVWK
jgi:hypothetical protein